MPDPHIDITPRLSSLPGPSRLVRISEEAFTALRGIVTGQGEDGAAAELSEQAVQELLATGLVTEDAEQQDALLLEEHWETALRAGLSTPVSVELLCVDGADAWISRILVAGRMVLVLDQVAQLEAGERSNRLVGRSSHLILGIGTIEHLSAIVQTLVPQHPALTREDASPSDQMPEGLEPVAETQLRVVSTADPAGALATAGGAFYAAGADGGVAVAAGQNLPGASLVQTVRGGIISAIEHAAAVQQGRAGGREVA